MVCAFTNLTWNENAKAERADKENGRVNSRAPTASWPGSEISTGHTSALQTEPGKVLGVREAAHQDPQLHTCSFPTSSAFSDCFMGRKRQNSICVLAAAIKSETLGSRRPYLWKEVMSIILAALPTPRLPQGKM